MAFLSCHQNSCLWSILIRLNRHTQTVSSNFFHWMRDWNHVFYGPPPDKSRHFDYSSCTIYFQQPRLCKIYLFWWEKTMTWDLIQGHFSHGFYDTFMCAQEVKHRVAEKIFNCWCCLNCSFRYFGMCQAGNAKTYTQFWKESYICMSQVSHRM